MYDEVFVIPRSRSRTLGVSWAGAKETRKPLLFEAQRWHLLVSQVLQGCFALLAQICLWRCSTDEMRGPHYAPFRNSRQIR